MQVYGLTLAGGSALGFALMASDANQVMRCDALTPMWLSVMIAAGALVFALSWCNPANRRVRLGLAIASEDTGGVVDILMLWAGDPDVDRVRLEEAMAELIDRFSNVLLDQIDLADIFQMVFAILRDFHLALPPDLALVLRTLLTAEGFVRRIDPAFDIARELAPIAKEMMRERASPARLRGEAGKLVAALGRAVLSTPSLVGQIEKVARTGSITVSIAPKDLERLRGRERAGRGTPQLYPATLAICAAIVFSSQPLLAGLLAFGAVALAVFEGVRRR